MKRKTFRLNYYQWVTMSPSHKLFSEVLVTSLIGGDIVKLLSDTLYSKGYMQYNSKITKSIFWYIPEDYVRSIIDL